jgi:hypothetical protein
MLSSRAHAIIVTNRGTRQATAQTRKTAETTISKPAAQTSKGHDHSRASATSAVRRATRGANCPKHDNSSNSNNANNNNSSSSGNKDVNNLNVDFVLCTVESAADGAITSVQTEGAIVDNVKVTHSNDLGSVTS